MRRAEICIVYDAKVKNVIGVAYNMKKTGSAPLKEVSTSHLDLLSNYQLLKLIEQKRKDLNEVMDYALHRLNKST